MLRIKLTIPMRFWTAFGIGHKVAFPHNLGKGMLLDPTLRNLTLYLLSRMIWSTEVQQIQCTAGHACSAAEWYTCDEV